MPKTLINQNTGDNYTDSGGANINSVYQSRGGWVTLPSTVYAQISHSPEGAQQGQEQWSEEFVLPSGAHYLQPGLIGIRFRSFTPGTPIAVSAALFFKDEPAMQLGGSGISTPSTSVASLNFQHNGLAVATENTLDFEDPASPGAFVWTVVDSPGVKVAATPVWNNPSIFPHPISTQPANSGNATTGFYADTTGIFITSGASHIGLTYSPVGSTFPNFRIQDAGIGFGGSATAIDTVMGWNNPGQLFLIQLPFGGTNTSSLILDNLWAGASQNTSPTFVAIQTSYGALTNHTFEVLANGQLNWGTGSAPTDTTLARTGAGVLETNSYFIGDGGVQSNGGFWSARTATNQVGYASYISSPLDTFDRFHIHIDGQMEWGSGAATQDAIIFRSAAHTLTTSDTGLQINRAVVGSFALSSYVTGDTVNRFQMTPDGKMNWGPGGAGALDTTLSRTSAAHLSLSNALYASAEIVSAMGGDGASPAFSAIGSATGAALNSGGVLQVSRATGNPAFTITNPSATTDWRFQISSDGSIAWAAPNTANDVSIGRSAVNTLLAQGNIFTTGGLLVEATLNTVGLGYATGVGSGGSVTQLTSLTTGVTINNLTGVITTATASFGAGIQQTFTVTNNTVAVTDTVIVCFRNQNWTQPVWLWVNHVQNGRFDISMFNLGAASNSAASSINFVVIKGSQN